MLVLLLALSAQPLLLLEGLLLPGQHTARGPCSWVLRLRLRLRLGGPSLVLVLLLWLLWLLLPLMGPGLSKRSWGCRCRGLRCSGCSGN